jgi:hypothetical protein
MSDSVLALTDDLVVRSGDSFISLELLLKQAGFTLMPVGRSSNTHNYSEYMSKEDEKIVFLHGYLHYKVMNGEKEVAFLSVSNYSHLVDSIHSLVPEKSEGKL